MEWPWWEWDDSALHHHQEEEEKEEDSRRSEKERKRGGLWSCVTVWWLLMVSCICPSPMFMILASVVGHKRLHPRRDSKHRTSWQPLDPPLPLS